jgi:phospholipid-binding lipoprotein MlaA
MTLLARPANRLRTPLVAQVALAAMVMLVVMGLRPAAAAERPAPRGADALQVEDPLERLNRPLYAIHQALDRIVLRPLALGFEHRTPRPLQRAIQNFVGNLGEPVTFLNDMLQGHFDVAGKTVGRFAMNSTIGIGGLFDPATKHGLPHHVNDLGITLARWGVAPGPYLFIPLLGPSNFRDSLATGAELYIDPIDRAHFEGGKAVLLGVRVIEGLHDRAMAEPDLVAINERGTDSYASMRSYFMQNRQGEILGRPVKIEELPQFDDELSPPPAPPAPGAPSAAANGAPTVARVPDLAAICGPDAAAFLEPPRPRTRPAHGPAIEL